MVYNNDSYEWLTVAEFRKRHGLGRTLVYEERRKGKLKSIKLGGKILIRSDSLDILAEEQV